MKKFIVLIFAVFAMCTSVYAEDTVTVYGDKTMHELHEYYCKTDRPMPMAEEMGASVTSTKLYDQLTETEKEIYDSIEKNIMNTLNGTTEISCEKKIYVGQGVDSKKMYDAIIEALGKETGEGSNIDMARLYFRPYYAFFSLDHPEYFWIDDEKITNNMKYTTSASADGYTTVTFNYVIVRDENKNPKYNTYLLDVYNDSPAAAKAEYEKTMAKADEIIASAPKGSNAWEKLNYYLLWLKDNCKYNEYLESNTLTKRARLAVSALLYGDKGKDAPVCEGYSEALKILCDKSGIDAMCVESATHKWNLIRINNRFYHCDPTWFDSMYVDEDGNPVKPFGLLSYEFFLVGSDTMNFQDKEGAHNMEYQYDVFSSPDVSASDYLTDMGFVDKYAYDEEYDEDIKYGRLDVNKDERITQDDSVTQLKIISGLSNGTAEDVNGDGKTNINDVVKMQKLMFG